MMQVLHPFFLVVIVVAAFVTLGIPRSKEESVGSLTTGAVVAGFAIAMNAVFQWDQPSPVNLLLMNEHAGTFEVVLISIAYAWILRGFVGFCRLGWALLKR
jgi:hypothetical protein